MNDSEFQYSRVPGFDQLMSGRLAGQGQFAGATPTNNGFDHHKLMVKKHKVDTGETLPEMSEAPQWPEEDIKALKDYCQRMGIIGFSTRQSPRLALAKLKQQVGDMSDISLENRTPAGYEKVNPPLKKTLLVG